jgi:hypothetical protein
MTFETATPIVPTLPETDLPVADPLREAQEAIEAIGADCLVSPREYLEEARVPLGGE